MSLNLNELKIKFGKNLIINENLSKYNWFNLGGPAEIFFRPQDKDQLLSFITEIKKTNVKIHILGAGSNTLIRDLGIKGVVIKLGSKFSETQLLEKDTIKVGASTLDKTVSNFAKDNNISGLEFLSCIPGSIGGAIIMNSGCYGSEISSILESISVIDIENGKEKIIYSDEIVFQYRGTNLPKELIILSAKFKGKISSKENVEKTQTYLMEKKKLSQPSQIKTCGSTFKNISDDKKAWMLIKEAGCNHLTEGDAVISQKHYNFFVNNGNAKSLDIENLINKVRERVLVKTGVNLELEIKIVGE